MADNQLLQTYLPLIADIVNFLVWFSMPGRLLTFRKNRNWIFAIAIILNILFAVACRSIPSMLTSPLKTIILFTVFLPFLFLCYDGSTTQKWIVFALWIVTITIADMLAVIAMSLLQISLTEPIGGLPVHLVSGLINAFLAYILMFITSMIYNKIKYKKVTNKMWQFQIVLFSQFLFLLTVGYISYKNDNTIESMVLRTPGYAILLVATIIVAVLADIFLYRILQTNSQNYELKNELEILQVKERLELEYYEKLRKSVAETRKLNHDFSNAIAVIESAISSPDVAENKKLASGVIEGIKETLKDAKIRYYCENELVNLLVISKSEDILNAGIDFSVNLDIPQNICIKNFDLCRLFTNLIDNAYDACRLSKNKERCFIVLSSQLTNEFIHISCENYFDTPINKSGNTLVSSKEGHKGLGLEVIRDISKAYAGNVSVKYENNIFTVRVSLKIS